MQKVVFLLFLLDFLWRLRVEFLHLQAFALTQRGKMADEGNEFPAILIVVAGRPESGHPAQPDAVFDGVIQFAVGHLLRIFLPHVRWSRIHGLPVHSVAAAVVGVAGGAVIRPMRHALLEELGGRRDGVLHGLLARWDCQVAHR